MSKARRRPWTDADVALLRAQFPHRRTADVAQALGRGYTAVAQKAVLLGLRKTREFYAGPEAGRLDGIRGASTRFQPGHEPWCKGTKGLIGVQPGCRATQFQPGRPAHEARNYMPVGSLRINADGYLERKVTDDPALMPARRWVAVHRLVWQSANGPVPEGHVVVFRAGRKTAELDAITLDAVELITRQQLMARNTVHTMPKALAELAQLRGVLTRHINRKAKEAVTP